MIASEVSSRKEALPRYLSGYGLIEAEVEHCVAALDGQEIGTQSVFRRGPSVVLVDPKKVELSLYRIIEKHFLAKLPGEEEPIITDTKKVVYTLNALCIEMDNRYDLLKEAGARNIREYNEKFIKRKLNPQKGHQYLPFIVLVIDEFADMIMTIERGEVSAI